MINDIIKAAMTMRTTLSVTKLTLTGRLRLNSASNVTIPGIKCYGIKCSGIFLSLTQVRAASESN